MQYMDLFSGFSLSIRVEMPMVQQSKQAGPAFEQIFGLSYFKLRLRQLEVPFLIRWTSKNLAALPKKTNDDPVKNEARNNTK